MTQLPISSRRFTLHGVDIEERIYNKFKGFRQLCWALFPFDSTFVKGTESPVHSHAYSINDPDGEESARKIVEESFFPFGPQDTDVAKAARKGFEGKS